MLRHVLTFAYVAAAAAFMRYPLAHSHGAFLHGHTDNHSTGDGSVLNAGIGREQDIQKVNVLQRARGNRSAKQSPGDGSYTETEHESWFDRMGDAMTEFAIGIVLIVFSTPVLWLNEKRAARMDSLIVVAQSEVESASARKADADNRGRLVHIQDGETNAAKSVAASGFSDVKFETGCLRLRSKVEVFQWIEKSQTTEKKDHVGGGKTKTTKYTYEQAWSTKVANPGDFKGPEARKYKNEVPKGVVIGEGVVDCQRVEYGDGFLLPPEMIGMLTNFVSIPSEGEGVQLGGNVTSSKGNVVFDKDEFDGLFYAPAKRDDPKVGDVRASFSYVPQGPASVLALQCEDVSDGKRDTFVPYRLFPRNWCGMNDDDKKRAALKEAKKDPEEIAAADQCKWGPFACLCCACNIVTMCCARIPPQVFHLAEGKWSESQLFGKVQSEATMVKWVLRVIGWLMMFVGLYCLFSPLLTFIDIIPFLGPLISTFGSYLIWIACFLVTLAISLLIICVAYLAYRPLVALMYAVLVALLVAIPLKIIPALQEKQSKSL